jgi:hypothetical protein
MALAAFAKKAATGLGLRCGAPALLDGGASLRALALRSYATGEGAWMRGPMGRPAGAPGERGWADQG